MKHFLLPNPPNSQGVIRLYGDDYHYLVRVRRLKAGRSFPALLPGGESVTVKIMSVVDGILIGECLMDECLPSTENSANASTQKIVLLQALPKGAKLDLIVRQAAESGVSHILPFCSEFSAVNTTENFGGKFKRFEKIIREARQQSGSVTETVLVPPVKFGEIFDCVKKLAEDFQNPVMLFLHQEPLEKKGFHGYLSRDTDFVCIAIGPEGGFSLGEVSQFLEAGFKPVLLGDTVLRTETAAISGITAVRIILLESDAWTPK